MPRSRRIVTALLAGLLVVPSVAAQAQTGADHWAVSENRLAYATNDTADALPTLDTVVPSRFPEAIAELDGPPFLYRVEGTLGTGTRVVRMVDAGSVNGLAEGRTPVIATAVARDDGPVGWVRQQHLVALYGRCPDGSSAGDCSDPALAWALADLSAPDGTPAGVLQTDVSFPLIANGTLDADGTLFSLGGDASVRTTLRVRDDGRITARGSADISRAIGGKLRGFEAVFVEDGAGGELQALLDRSLEERARAVGRTEPNEKGVFRSVLECPSSGRGHVVSQFLVRGAGSNIGPAINGQLDGGAPLLITEVRPFECTPPVATPLLEPPAGPAAAVVCAWAKPRHRQYAVTTGGQTTAYNSSWLMRYVFATFGLSPEPGQGRLDARVGGANGGEFFADTPERTSVGSPWGPIELWYGEAEVGINEYGPKPYRDLQLSVDGQAFDMAPGWRTLMGAAFDVGPAQRPDTNCPDLELTAAEAQVIFADGFEYGDVSAWTPASPD